MSTEHQVAIDLKTLIALVDEVANADPIDYANLAIDEKALRQACCEGAMTILQNATLYNAEEVMYVLLSAMAKLIEENVTLHAQNLQRGESVQNHMVQQILKRAKKGI